MVMQTKQQLRASDPKSSVWVGASAGTGKTFVLSNRVLRLMLSGSRPDKILCLTYTKTAAAEMAIRVNNKLSGWVKLSDGDLIEELTSILGTKPDAEQLINARKLYAEVLDIPGGLKFQTIHSFCQSLLGRFPIEADIAPNFDLLDDITISEQLRLSQDEILLDISAGKNSGLADALEHVSGLLAEETFSKLMKKLAGEREELNLMLTRQSGSLEKLLSELKDMLGLEQSCTKESILSIASDGNNFDEKGLRLAAEILKSGGKTDLKRSETIFCWINNKSSRKKYFDEYLRCFLKADGEFFKSYMSKKLADKYQNELGILIKEAERIKKINDQLKAYDLYKITKNVLLVGYQLIGSYNRRKKNKNVMDFDDLIARVRKLLHEVSASWILYKLDGGIDHILIDEAQDTNPIQWDIIRKITEEFFSGEGTRDPEKQQQDPRTIFAVGDIKQSIYSFQGAEPEKFQHNRDYFIDAAKKAELSFDEVPMNLSFRSTTAVLETVDHVFKSETLRQSISFSTDDIQHDTHRTEEPGLIEVWPTVKPQPKEEDDGWQPPVIQKPSHDPKRIVAEKIADQIKNWLDNDEILPSKGRKVRAGDVLVLVRRRAEFVGYMISALKKRDIAVAGLDRMALTNELSVMDLMAVANFTLLPSDDLTLAVVLKSPFIGLGEEDLFDLSYGRSKSDSLWTALLRRRSERPSFTAAADYLSRLTNYADFHPPFEFFTYLLGPLRGREKLISRLGEQINDPVDEFLNQAMKYEQNNTSSMQGFLSWISKGDIEIKREMEQAGDMVRIMTAHAAKGLQAPIVFLPDTCSIPDLGKEAILWHDDVKNKRKMLLLKQSKSELTGIAKDAYEKREKDLKDEYLRLLYVAMTRAEDQLYVTGFESSRGIQKNCWYDLIYSAVSEMDGTKEIKREDDIVLRLERHYPGTAKEENEKIKENVIVDPLPAWAKVPPPPEPTPSRPLSPSRPTEEEKRISPLGISEYSAKLKTRFQRGNLIHKLLETLPGLDISKREDAARRFLEQAALDIDKDDVEQITREVLLILEDPEFAELFSKQSRAEVPIVGQVGNYTLSGQVDRLVVTDSEVLIVDYKTNRPPPDRPEEIDTIYVRQMAAYRAVLNDIYPDLKVRSFLLWTDICQLMEIPDELLDKIEF